MVLFRFLEDYLFHFYFFLNENKKKSKIVIAITTLRLLTFINILF
jgi:hypothetical protein